MDIRKDIQQYRKDSAQVNRLIKGIESNALGAVSLAVIWLLKQWLIANKP